MDDSTVKPRLRWGRAFVAGLLAELVLMAIAVPAFVTLTNPTPLLNAVIPPASLAVFVAAGWWSAKPVPAIGVLQGALAAIIAVALYVGLVIVELLFRPGAQLADSLTGPYLLAHALKLLGATLGGWLVSRKAAQPTA